MKKQKSSSQNRKPYKVFVSSTYMDNKERRKLVQEAIATVGMVWHGMEIFTVNIRPTEEECLRHVKEADLLAGIIAWRYGWIPEGEEISITVMEYDAAKERLMFQIDASLPVDIEKDFDPGPDKWDTQKKLDSVKKRFSKDQMLVYFDEKTLQAKVLQALQGWKDQRESPPEQEALVEEDEIVTVSEPDLTKEIKNYRQKAQALHEALPMAGDGTQITVPINIEDIHVLLHAVVDLSGRKGSKYADASQAAKYLQTRDAGLEITLLDAFKQTRQRGGYKGLVILGDPGSGKTTHLKRVLLYCLHEGHEALRLSKDMLSVFLPLRELNDLDQGLDVFIQEQLAGPNLQTSKDFGVRLLQRGNLLFLLDGLDEVPDLARREEVATWIIDALNTYPTCSFVVTCRFAGYSETVRLSAKFLEMHIRPFTTEQANTFIHQWYQIVERGLAKDLSQAEIIAKNNAEDLIENLKQPNFRSSRIFELTRNPLLLTNICLVHRFRSKLPDSRADLYQECINVLLEHWRAAKKLQSVKAKDGYRVLQPVAYWLHGEEGRTRATADQLSTPMETGLKAVGWNKGGAQGFLSTIRDESGLLTGWDQDSYGFMHLGFQEYLAAREIRRRFFEGEPVVKELASHFGESWWQEVGLLLLALDDPSLFKPYMQEVIKLPAFTEHVSLVEACLTDAAEKSAEPFLELLEISPGKDEELWQRQLLALQIVERLDADAIEGLKARLTKHPFKDIRKRLQAQDVQATQEVKDANRGGYELVRIVGGRFMMGSPKKEESRYEWEGPQHKVEVSDFYIGRYPVTNQEYGEFLKDNPKISEPEYWSDRRFNQPKQPVVGVSWEDAKQYANWAGLRLPTEEEWEYACRAGTSSRYYLGNTEKALQKAGWYEKNSDGHLQPVGGKEPNGFGLYDMHGNVWEWIEDDWHENYKGAPKDGSSWIDNPRGSLRVLRGGSWNGRALNCRSAIRICHSPGFRDFDIGFRLARSVGWWGRGSLGP